MPASAGCSPVKVPEAHEPDVARGHERRSSRLLFLQSSPTGKIPAWTRALRGPHAVPWQCPRPCELEEPHLSRVDGLLVGPGNTPAHHGGSHHKGASDPSSRSWAGPRVPWDALRQGLEPPSVAGRRELPRGSCPWAQLPRCIDARVAMRSGPGPQEPAPSDRKRRAGVRHRPATAPCSSPPPPYISPGGRSRNPRPLKGPGWGGPTWLCSGAGHHGCSSPGRGSQTSSLDGEPGWAGQGQMQDAAGGQREG